MYRYHTLRRARAQGGAHGLRGRALRLGVGRHRRRNDARPQSSAPIGEIIDVLCGEQEHHISADIAYAVWQYWQATGRRGVPARGGRRDPGGDGPLLGEPRRAEADGRFHIRGVIGPDEYHERSTTTPTPT